MDIAEQGAVNGFEGQLVSAHERGTVKVASLPGFREIRPRIVGLVEVEAQADVVGEAAERVAAAGGIAEVAAHAHGIDGLQQVGGGALPCVAVGRKGEDSDDFAFHGF